MEEQGKEISEKSKTKTNLHPRNKNREQYDLKELIKEVPELKKHIQANKQGEDTIRFSEPEAVKLLNKAILGSCYGIKNWDFPDTNLCPPIPGRADYIHHVADLIKGKKNITCLDIGVGANCIYPILGISEYNWHFIATDVNKEALSHADKIIKANPTLKGKAEFRLQEDKNNIFKNIIKTTDKIHLSICNPPFHATDKDALKGSMRKVRNLTGKRSEKIKLNFSGMTNELVYEGGEKQFIQNMIIERITYSENCLWFTTLVSNERNLNRFYSSLEKYGAKDVKTIHMGTGNKISRIIAWTFLTKEEQRVWKRS